MWRAQPPSSNFDRPNRKHSFQNLCLPAPAVTRAGQGYWFTGRYWKPFFPLGAMVDRTRNLAPMNYDTATPVPFNMKIDDCE